MLAAAIMGCARSHRYPTIGHMEKLDPSLDTILSAHALPEIIADGFDWSEGPLWLDATQTLIFSDVPQNTIYQWTETGGKKIYLSPSGYTDTLKRGGETGSNGLALDKEGQLLLCQCGNRQVARMQASLQNPSPAFTTLAGNFGGKKFNSPNDLAVSSRGEIFFTDPPYGLEKNMGDPKKEIPFQGVYKIKTDGTVVLLTDTLTRPNGILLLPGEKTLLVANSDPQKPYWYAFDLSGDSLTHPRIFYSAAGYDPRLKGLPDGMKTDKAGNIYATGPGGLWIFNSTGILAGKILLPEALSNCALSSDEKTLYLTNDGNVLRLRLKK